MKAVLKLGKGITQEIIEALYADIFRETRSLPVGEYDTTEGREIHYNVADDSQRQLIESYAAQTIANHRARERDKA